MDKDTTFKLIMVGLLNQERERRNAVARARMEKIKSDPELCAGHKKKMRVKQLAWYHRTKHSKGIKDRVSKTKEEQRVKSRAGERRRYREQRAKIGLEVKAPRPKGSVSEERLRAEQNETCRRYRARHLERRRKSAREWERRNRHQSRARTNFRYRNDPLFNLVTKIRRRIYMALKNAGKGTRKRDKTIDLLGCSYYELKAHIEKQFKDGMTWDKVMTSEIHLDHIVPIAYFDMSDMAQQRAAFHYTNTQPMWAQDNLSKNSFVNGVKHTYSKSGVEQRSSGQQ